jgi:hypothetical protein
MHLKMRVILCNFISQTQTHETLMKAQQGRLGNLRSWLTEAEDRISRMDTSKDQSGKVNPAHLNRLKNCLGALLRDLEGKQPVVDSLSTMVVVVDDIAASSDDTGKTRWNLMKLY